MAHLFHRNVLIRRLKGLLHILDLSRVSCYLDELSFKTNNGDEDRTVSSVNSLEI